jgi:hypothetical protein
MEKQWFVDRIGQFIFREGHGSITDIEVTEKNVDYLHSLQEKGFIYREKQPAGRVRVHSGPPESTCVSCEG